MATSHPGVEVLLLGCCTQHRNRLHLVKAAVDHHTCVGPVLRQS
jgi:hypothetical protein